MRRVLDGLIMIIMTMMTTMVMMVIVKNWSNGDDDCNLNGEYNDNDYDDDNQKLNKITDLCV